MVPDIKYVKEIMISWQSCGDAASRRSPLVVGVNGPIGELIGYQLAANGVLGAPLWGLEYSTALGAGGRVTGLERQLPVRFPDRRERATGSTNPSRAQEVTTISATRLTGAVDGRRNTVAGWVADGLATRVECERERG